MGVVILKIGIVARADNTGLGNQTRELVRMLNPHKILLINSYYFNRNTQNKDWYKDYNCIETEGFASNEEVAEFLRRIPEAANNDVLIIANTEVNTDEDRDALVAALKEAL